METPPDFILAGVGKSGSTSLWHYLKKHPDLCMAREKEPLFFTEVRGRSDGGDWKAPTRSGRYHRGIDWYRGLYGECEVEQLLGEASVSYFYVEDAPALIEKHVPNVKLLFILRDPVDRFYSHYWQARKGAKDVPDSFEKLLNSPENMYYKLFKWVSSYRKHLSRFRSRFSASQMSILFHTDLVSSPVAVLKSCYEFLNIRRDFIPDNLGDQFNPASLPRSHWFQRLLAWARGTAIKQILPARLRRFGSNLVGFLSRLNKSEFDYPSMDPGHRSELIDLFEEDIEYVEELTGRSLDDWKTVERVAAEDQVSTTEETQ